MKYKLYEVGGKIRDEILGLKSKDVDYSVVLEDIEQDPLVGFNNFLNTIKKEGYKVFLPTPECFTIRAKFPDNHKFSGLVADFVLARKEVGYIPGTRQPIVKLGILEDDLIRRDFTVNSLAKDIDGNIIDLFEGIKDLKDNILRTPTDTAISFNNDPLRIVRAMRFNITKGLDFSDDIWRTISTFDFIKFKETVSKERVREELTKMFMHDTLKTLDMLSTLSKINYLLYSSIMSQGLRLKPTFKE